LGKLSVLVAEKGAFVGGTAGTERHGDFLFDHTGHLLHLHDSYGKKFILDLLKGNWALHARSSWIYSQNAFTRYPFQANTYGLPWPAVEDCAAGFLRTVHKPVALGDKPSFKDWSLATFGAGISKHFMFPYNEKLWRSPLSALTTEWQGRFVPKPGASEVLYGALMDQKKFFGYNADFRYPVRGGIQVLPDALAARLKPGQVRTGCSVRYVDLASKTAVIENLGEVQFERLVNTMPLVDFLDLCWPLPQAVTVARMRLRYNTVYNLNLGVARARMSDKHWVYFPEKKYPFYRVGYSSNFSPRLGPKGTSSLYIEVSRRADDKVDLEKLENQVLAGLRSAGVLKSTDKLLAKVWMPIRCGYVVYDFDRTPAVTAIFKHLAKIGVESIGRYGAWKYSFMEETILDGKRCAERLLGVDSVEKEAASTSAALKALK
jgi:protoporphyrinogen oxidase